MLELSIFAMELCYRFDPALHAILRDHATAQPAALGLHEKWVAYRNAESDLLANLDRVDRGCWDYFNDDTRAKSDFQMWVGGMTTDETARTSPSSIAYRLPGTPNAASSPWVACNVVTTSCSGCERTSSSSAVKRPLSSSAAGSSSRSVG